MNEEARHVYTYLLNELVAIVAANIVLNKILFKSIVAAKGAAAATAAVVVGGGGGGGELVINYISKTCHMYNYEHLYHAACLAQR